MSFVFDIGDETVWSPGNLVAELYLGTVDTLTRLLDQPSGLTDLAGTWFTIEPDTYRNFVAELLRVYTDSGHWEFRCLLRGPLIVSIGILHRAGIPLAGQTDDEVAALAELRTELPL
ncbi:DUF6086 family protein [Dactylosporangium sp. NPDC048998]|uniref:DUF6086 family protein n=1 Tax=Dactylosporangium sp. NPDC048998 TaxID=3363976 RepID=UPI0037204D35